MGISFCIPTYNRLFHLKKCLSSIIDGIDGYPYEIIIADGGSTDGTIEYLQGLNNINVKLIKMGCLTGAVKAFNTCFKEVKYEYVYWSCDDYIIIPKVLIRCCKFMDNHSEVGMISPKFIESTRSNFPNIGTWKYMLVLSKTHVFRTSVLKEIDYFDEYFKTYYIDPDSHLAVLTLGYVTLFTCDVGVIHNRVDDELRKKNIPNMLDAKKEYDYYNSKWNDFDNCLNSTVFKKWKVFQYWRLKNKLRDFNIIRFLMQNNFLFMIKLYDWILKRCIIFKAEDYYQFKDFYLAQRIPKDFILFQNYKG